jgi:exopolysaccharide production protein ExoZ
MKPIVSIQYIRALAALGIVLFHASMAFYRATPLAVGKFGVDIFFIVSGFIMFVITEKRESSPALFLGRRLARIVPLYWLVTLVMIAIVLVRPKLGPEMGADIHLNHVLPSLFFLPHVNSLGETYPTVRPGWSLNFEMFFYVLMTLALFLPRARQIWVVTGVLIALILAGIFVAPHSTFAGTYTSPRMIEFVAGLWLARCWMRECLPDWRIGIASVIAGFALVVIGHFAHYDDFGNFYIPYAALSSFLIVLGALSIEAGGKLFHSSWLKLIGDASYSIYLLHDFVIPVIVRTPLPAPVQFIAMVLLSIAVGIGSFHFFERPVHRLAMRLIK